MQCPVNNIEFDKVHAKYGQNIAARLWKDLGDNIKNEVLVERHIKSMLSQDNVVKQLNQKSAVTETLVKLRNPQVELKDNNYYTKSKELVKNRVSDYVARYKKEVQGLDFAPNNDLFNALKGTLLHSYLENILTSLFDGKIPTQSEVYNLVYNKHRLADEFKDKDAKFYQMDASQFGMLTTAMKELKDQIYKLQKEVDPKGKVNLFTETALYDLIQKDAGTLDALFVFSDGSAGIVDFKSFVGKAGVEPGSFKIAPWQVQMQNYKRMLKNNYGIQKFRFSRNIPIQTNYTKYVAGKYERVEAGFRSISIQTEQNKSLFTHLNPIPIEEYTGLKEFDELLSYLYQQIYAKSDLMAQLKNQKNDTYFKTFREIEKLQSAANKLQLDRDINGITYILRDKYKNIKERIALESTNPNAFTLGEIASELRELQLYSDISTAVKSENTDLNAEQKQKLNAKLGEITSSLNELITTMNEKLLEHLSPDITEPGNVPGQMGRLFKGLANYNMPIFRDLNKYLRYSREKTRRETMQEIEYIKTIDDEFSKWASQNGLSQMKKFDLIYNSENGQLHKKYTKNFWTRLGEVRKRLKEKTVTQEDKQFIKDNFTFNKDKYEIERKNFEKSIAQQVKEGTITEEVAGKRKQQWYSARNMGENQENFLLTASLLQYYEASTSDAQYTNSEWKYIQNNKALKDYYDMYLQYNEKYTEHFGNKIGRHFVANVQQSLIDSFIELGPGAVKDIGIILERAYAIRENDELFGSVDPVTGESKKTIPLLFTDPIRKPLNNSRKAEIENELDAEGIYEKGTSKYELELESRIKAEEYKEGRKIKSKDLTKSLMLFVNSANEHLNLKSAENYAKGIKYLIDFGYMKSYAVTPTGETMLNKYTKDIMGKLGIPADLIVAFDQFIDRDIYKTRFKEDIRLGGKYSLTKIATSLMQYLSVKALGLNLVVTGANFIQARSSLYMKSKEDIHFGGIELGDTFESFRPSSMKNEKWNMLINYFEPTTRDRVKEVIDQSGANLGSKLFTQRNAFIGHILGDDNVDNLLLVAMSKRYVMDSDGKIKNPKIHKILNPEAKTVFDSIEMVNNVPVVVGLSLENAADFRAKVQKVAFQIKGMTSEETKGLYSANLVHTAFMQFRTWIPGLFEERFNALQYDETLENIEEGRFRVVMGELLGNGLIPNLKSVLQLGLELIPFTKNIKSIDKDYVQLQLNKFLEANPNLRAKLVNNEIDYDTLVDQMVHMKRAKLNAFITELRVWLSLLVLTQLLGGLDWDDDDEANLFSWNAHRIAQRALLEVTFWFSPGSVSEIIKSPLPVWNVLSDLYKMSNNAVLETKYIIEGDRPANDKTPPAYYFLKSVPVANQFLSVTGYFNTYATQKSLIKKLLE